MSRCRCDPAIVTGCSIDDSDCIGVTGSGSTDNPYLLSPILDPSTDNLTTCGVSGLLTELPELIKNPPRVFVRRTVDQLIPALDVPQFIEFNRTEWDIGGWFDVSVDPTIITVPTDGLYIIHYELSLDPPGPSYPASERAMRGNVFKNFLTQVISDETTSTNNATATRVGKSKDVPLIAGDQLSLRIQNGATIDLNSSPEQFAGDDGGAQFIQARWVAPLPVYP